jgi:hypothetical protein
MMLFDKIKFLLILHFILFPIRSASATAVCIGFECSFLSEQTLIAANLADPVLNEIYTKDFLSSMSQSAVLQNINSTMMGGTNIEKNRISLGYSIARSNIKPRDFYFQATELRELPTQGVAASPSFAYAFNLGHVLEKSGEWRKWNLYLQFFPFYLSESNIPLLKIRNTDVDGRVANMSINARYFPLFDGNVDSVGKGLSFGFGLFNTNQEILLSSYDRRPSQFQVDGDRRRWLGTNTLKYESKIYSSSADVRYSYGISRLSLFGGMGLMYNHGVTMVKVERIAFISSYLSRDDFLTNPSAIGLNVSRKIEVREANFYGIIGIQYKWESIGIGVEYLKNKNTESLNLGVHYYF